MSKCPKCGQEVQSKFCPDCGINVQEPPKCPKCGAIIGSRYCPDCGFDTQAKEKATNKIISKLKNVFNKCKSFFLANKKKCTLVGSGAIVSIVTVIVLVASLSNIFRVGKVSKIEIGTSKSRVIDILGEPTLDDEGTLYWYEDKVAKKINKAESYLEKLDEDSDEDEWEKAIEKYDEIYAEIEETTYNFIMVKLDGENKVREVFLDKNHKYDEEDDYATEEKECKKLLLNLDNIEGYTETTNGQTVVHLTSNPNKITYTIKFTDGSYCLNTTYQSSMEITVDGSKCYIKWHDKIANYETTKPFVATGAIVDGVLTNWQTTAENVVLPETVIDIGTALKGNTTMKQITLPSALAKISESAFEGCTSLESIDIPSSVTAIKAYAFKNCSSLTQIKISKNVASIGENAFLNCEKLFVVTNLSSLNIIEGDSKYGGVGKYALVVYKTLNPESVLERTNEGFYFLVEKETTTLLAYDGEGTNIVFPEAYKDRIYTIKSGIFKGNKKIQSVVFPSFLTEIGEEAFKDCSSLTSITIPIGVTKIYTNAFYRCSLKSVTIPESISYIGVTAFYHNPLEVIYYNAINAFTAGVVFDDANRFIIGEKVEYIEPFTEEFRTIEVDPNNENYTIINGSLYSKDETKLIRYVEGSEKHFKIPAKTTFIEKFAFDNVGSLETIIIPTTVTKIGGSGFRYCGSLKIFCEATERPRSWDYLWFDDSFSSSSVYWYSESEPTDTSGNYWHYGDNGEIAIWE